MAASSFEFEQLTPFGESNQVRYRTIYAAEIRRLTFGAAGLCPEGATQATGSGPLTQPLDAGLAGRLDAAFDRALAEQRLVGGIVLVAEGGRPAYARAAGLADRRTRPAM